MEEKIQKLEDELDENKQSVFRKRTLLNNKISENTLQIVAQQKNTDDLKEHDLQQEKALSLLQFDVHQAQVHFKPSLFLRRFWSLTWVLASLFLFFYRISGVSQNFESSLNFTFLFTYFNKNLELEKIRSSTEANSLKFQNQITSLEHENTKLRIQYEENFKKLVSLDSKLNYADNYADEFDGLEKLSREAIIQGTIIEMRKKMYN